MHVMGGRRSRNLTQIMRREGKRERLQREPRLPVLVRAWFGRNALNGRLNACSARGLASGVRLRGALPKTASETRHGGPSGPRLAARIISSLGIWFVKVRPPASIDRSMNSREGGGEGTEHRRQGRPHSRRVAALPPLGLWQGVQAGRTGA